MDEQQIEASGSPDNDLAEVELAVITQLVYDLAYMQYVMEVMQAPH